MPSGKMWTQLKRRLWYADGLGNESKPLVVYVSSDAENGSDGGRVDGSGSPYSDEELLCAVDDRLFGSLKSRII